jgi:hypothetical protein
MLRFVVHADHRMTLLPYVEQWAGDLARRIEIIGYDELFHSARVPLCTHVFTDVDRLTPEERENAAYIWAALERAPSPVKLLNHPLRVRCRYELLRELKERGLNDFDVYRLSEHRTPTRFPVFLRNETDHFGPESGLLDSREKLDAAIDALRAEGKCPAARLAVEYAAEPAADGLFRKYGAFCVEGTVIPRHVLFARDWIVKGKTKVLADHLKEEERLFMTESPHAGRVAAIFRIARTDYGRIDYTFVGGRLQTYEINLNPTVINAGPLERTKKKTMFTDALTAAFVRLEAASPDGAGARPRMLRLAPPLKERRARISSRVLRHLLGRQLRPTM